MNTLKVIIFSAFIIFFGFAVCAYGSEMGYYILIPLGTIAFFAFDLFMMLKDWLIENNRTSEKKGETNQSPTASTIGLDDGDLSALDVADKKAFTIETIAEGLTEMCIKELAQIAALCQKHQVGYDKSKLYISTFCYFYAVWLMNFASITLRQSEQVKKIYKNKFYMLNNACLENALENEVVFEEMWSRVDARTHNAYHAHNQTFIDDGISDEFIMEFIDNPQDMEKIKGAIVIKVLRDWASTAQMAGKHAVIID